MSTIEPILKLVYIELYCTIVSGNLSKQLFTFELIRQVLDNFRKVTLSSQGCQGWSSSWFFHRYATVPDADNEERKQNKTKQNQKQNKTKKTKFSAANQIWTSNLRITSFHQLSNRATLAEEWKIWSIGLRFKALFIASYRKASEPPVG